MLESIFFYILHVRLNYLQNIQKFKVIMETIEKASRVGNVQIEAKFKHLGHEFSSPSLTH